jgi:hypothetical protein
MAAATLTWRPATDPSVPSLSPMKIEIDLDDIFRDEDGCPEESTQESIRRQVLARLTSDYRDRLFKRFDDQLAKMMQAQIQEVMKSQMPSLVDDIMNASFTPVSNFGQRSDPTTFRAQIIKSIAANLVYAPKNYASEENAFTSAVRGVVKEQINAFEKSFKEQIDDKFKKDAIAFAVEELRIRLQLPK